MKKITVVVLAIACVGCSSNKNRDGITSFTKIDSLRANFLAINDSLLHSWQVMIKDDNEKLDDMSRLLDEISYTNNYDETKLKDYRHRIDTLKAMRYNQKTMWDSKLIDQYDETSHYLVNDLLTYAENHPDYSRFPTMATLVQDIRQAHQRVLYFRIDYDEYAKEYNKFVTSYQGLLSEIDNTCDGKKKALFQLAVE